MARPSSARSGHARAPVGSARAPGLDAATSTSSKPPPAVAAAHTFTRKLVSPRKPQVPRCADAAQRPRTAAPDFVRANRRAAVSMTALQGATPPRGGAPALRDSSSSTAAAPARSSPSKGAPVPPAAAMPGAPPLGGSFGRVPAYLRRRRHAERAAAAEAARLAGEPGCPPGTRRMSADKQSRLFSALRQSEQELCAELLTLPLASDAPKVVRRRAELEGRLAEVQEAAAVFAGDVVFEDVEQLDDAEAGGSAGDHRRARQVRDAGRLANVGSQL